MSRTPDRVTADLRVHEARVDQREKFADAHRAEAEEKLKEQLRVYNTDPAHVTKPSIEWVMEQLADDLPDALGDDYQAFLQALAKCDISELGLLIEKAVGRIIDKLVERNTELVDDILDDMEEGDRG